MPETSDPARRDVVLWRGANDPPVIWEFGDQSTPDILSGSTFQLVIRWPGGGMERAGSGEALAISGRRITWAPTITDTQTIPRGLPVAYELRRTIDGKTRPWVVGSVIVKSGLPRG